MSKPFRYTLIALATATLASQALAQEGPTVTISGFGTAALTMSDTDDAEFIRPNQAAGVRKDPRTGVDSNFGIQATIKLNDRISFTGQGLARKNAIDHYRAEAAWAYAKFKATDEVSFRVGRMGTPVYMISDFRNVGYANTMLRPPAEVYRQVYGDSFDGTDVLYQHSFGDTTLSAQAAVGRTKVEVVGSDLEFKPLFAMNAVLENGPFTVRLSRVTAKFSISGSPTLAAIPPTLRSVGLGAVADMLPMDDVKGSFTSFGATMDWKNIVLQSEYAMRRTDTLLVPDTNSWYLMAGYRIGKVLPYYYHGNITQKSVRNIAALPTTGPLAPLSAGINSTIKSALQSADAIGVRWDFHKSMALKAQVDHIKPREDSGAFIKATPGFRGPANVYAVALDFVF